MNLTKQLISGLILATSIQQQSIAAEVQLDSIEAIVNEELILASDLSRMKREITLRYQQSGQALPDQANLDKQILDKLISDRLQLQIADNIGLRISDTRLNQTLEEMAKNQNTTLSQMRNEMESSGINYDAFVDNIRDEITINEVRQAQVRRRVTISEQEVEQMVERINQEGQQTTEFHFAHILIKMSPDTPADKKLEIDQKADDLVKQIQDGADITRLAVSYSEGPKSLEGGDWGWRKMDSIPSLFVSNFKETNKKGDIIGPFHSKMGVHIIEILDKKGAENVITEEVSSRHILIQPNIILSDEKAKELLDTIRQQIIDGSKTFAELAREYSQDTGSAVKGGDLGWADPTLYVPEFRDAALSQKIGEISQPFHTAHGWHILEVMDRRQADITEEATKQKAYSLIYRQRFPAEGYAWLNEIRQEAYIKIMNPAYIIEEE